MTPSSLPAAALAGLLGLATVRAEDGGTNTNDAPAFRTLQGGIRSSEPGPAPVAVPPSAKPPVETATVERIGTDGITAFDAGRYDEAREAYLRVLKIEPNNLAALVNLGAAEYRLGNLAESERHLRRSLQIKPDNPTAWLNLGIIYLERGEAMRALAAMAQAVVHSPRDPVARQYLGVAAGRNGWFDAAESELRRAIELKPDYADAHFNLAVFCLERTPPAVELARRHYREAVRLGAAPDPLIEKALKN
jgi:Flp pilus assembly protein TadD